METPSAAFGPPDEDDPELWRFSGTLDEEVQQHFNVTVNNISDIVTENSLIDTECGINNTPTQNKSGINTTFTEEVRLSGPRNITNDGSLSQRTSDELEISSQRNEYRLKASEELEIAKRTSDKLEISSQQNEYRLKASEELEIASHRNESRSVAESTGTNHSQSSKRLTESMAFITGVLMAVAAVGIQSGSASVASVFTLASIASVITFGVAGFPGIFANMLAKFNDVLDSSSTKEDQKSATSILEVIGLDEEESKQALDFLKISSVAKLVLIETVIFSNVLIHIGVQVNQAHSIRQGFEAFKYHYGTFDVEIKSGVNDSVVYENNFDVEVYNDASHRRHLDSYRVRIQAIPANLRVKIPDNDVSLVSPIFDNSQQNQTFHSAPDRLEENATVERRHDSILLMKCLKCGETSHLTDNCPNLGCLGEKFPKCLKCGGITHTTEKCPHQVSTLPRVEGPSCVPKTTNIGGSGGGVRPLTYSAMSAF